MKIILSEVICVGKNISGIPEIYSAISIVFKKDADVIPIIEELNGIGIPNIAIRTPKIDPVVCLDIAIVKNESFWELNDALSKMFMYVDGNLHGLKEITQKYRGEIWIDMAFYQHGTYPALIISGQNMKKIHFLEANISIDPY